MSDWMDLLRAEKGRGRTTASIARELGFARTSISLLFSGNYPAKDANGEPAAPRIATRVLELYGGKVACPHLGRDMDRAECGAMRDAPMPASSPDKLRHWTACRSCPLNPAAAAAPTKRK